MPHHHTASVTRVIRFIQDGTQKRDFLSCSITLFTALKSDYVSAQHFSLNRKSEEIAVVASVVSKRFIDNLLRHEMLFHFIMSCLLVEEFGALPNIHLHDLFMRERSQRGLKLLKKFPGERPVIMLLHKVCLTH